MRFNRFYTTIATLCSLTCTVTAYTGNLVATYWGQGLNQQRLSVTCSNPNIDIVVLSFVYQFPDAAPGGVPGTNFGNACGPGAYSTPSGMTTNLLTNCPNVGPDIQYCQSQGKIVLLSLGGAGGNMDQYIKSDASGVSFANYLIGAFGPPNSSWKGPRPFGSAFVNGFDFDVESTASQIPSGTLTTGYHAMITQLKAMGTKYVSWSPQCIDEHLNSAILSNSAIDFLFVQFYNTPSCSAMSYINNPSSTGFTNSFNFYANSKPNVKVLIGLPASPAAANPGFYLTISQVHTLLGAFGSNAHFAGISVWESTYSQQNQICGIEYASWMKSLLLGQGASTNYGQVCSSTALTVSPRGTCGGNTGYTCAGSNFGPCCSSSGSCGSTSLYCGTGCQLAFGTCPSSASSSSSTLSTSSRRPPSTISTISTSTPTPSPPASAAGSSRPITTDGSCGGSKGYRCSAGNCCSQYGWCGASSLYCGAGCQSPFGLCY